MLGLFQKNPIISLELFLPEVNFVISMRDIKGVGLCSLTRLRSLYRLGGASLGLDWMH